MAGYFLNTNATLQCPHGGQVSITSSNTRVKADGAPLALQSDTYSVSGCSFTLPGPKPSPCVRVQWVAPDMRTKANSNSTLSQACTGICFSGDNIPQGPVVVVNAQSKARTA